MTEVILNDECVHCNDKECHDGEHFCRQAMKDNSFYKNARLYKGLEVIQRPSYEELEKENEELNDKLNNLSKVAEVRLANWQKYEQENAELKKKIENLQKYLDTRNCYRECAETWEKLTKAKKIIGNLYAICKDNHYPNTSVLMEQAAQFLKESE